MITWKLTRRLAIVAVLAGLLLLGNDLAAEEAKVVRVVIDYNDGSQRHFTRIAWKEKMTVLDAMIAVKAHPRGVDFKQKGREATAFLTEIDKVKNEGQGRNWLFSVNGKQADRSCGVFELKTGDAVLWKFDKYR